VQRRGLHRGVWIHCQDSRGYPYVVAAWIWHYPGVRGSVLLVGEDSRCYVLASWHRDQGWMFRYDARRPRPGNVLSPPL
jgi:hypothetical protein